MSNTGKNNLPDEDVRAAMQSMSEYIDITPGDFCKIYEMAHEQTIKRLFTKMSVANLLRKDLSALNPNQSLTEAVEYMASMHAHTLPVVDSTGLVLGDVSECNFLRGFGADTFFFLVFRLMAHDKRFIDYCERTTVSDVMTTPAVTLSENGTFADIARSFHQAEEKRLPVVDDEIRLVGVVMRRDFLERFHLDEWL